MLEIVTKLDGWNHEILRLSGGFLQSWQWGEFQQAAGHQVMRLRGNSFLAQCVRHALPFGQSYWYCPRGPLGTGYEVFPAAKEFHKATFIRFEPQLQPKLTGAQSVSAAQPSQTLIVDLVQTPEALLAAMHEKTRYNIRLAERKGVQVRTWQGTEDEFENFWCVMNETTARDEFHSHGKEYYQSMLKILGGNEATSPEIPWAELLFAEHDGKILAANLMIYFGGTATYLHGASSSMNREMMAPHLLHWQAMQRAKSLGCTSYDFWGVAPADQPNHSWAGISRFKKGFGGTYIEYPGTFDVPINKFWYGVYSLVQKLRGR